MEDNALGRAPRRKREETKAENRAAILNAARVVFAELGYGATTVRDIIRANLASGTFYNYFKSKEEVFQAINDETALRIRPRLRAERIRAPDFESFISGTFRTFFDVIYFDRHTFATMRSQAHQVRVRFDTPEVIAGFDELRADIELAIERGVLPRTDSDLLMSAFVGVAFEVGERLLQRDDLTVRQELGASHYLPLRTSRPGSAPVAWPSRETIRPLTIVAV
jgi:AcrR family transcriptional regulator